MLVLEGSPPEDDDLELVDGEARLFHKKGCCDGPAVAVSEGEPTDTLARRRLQDALVTAHLGLACSLARRFGHRGEAVEDLEAVASLALVKAARRYGWVPHRRWRRWRLSWR